MFLIYINDLIALLNHCMYRVKVKLFCRRRQAVCKSY